MATRTAKGAASKTSRANGAPDLAGSDAGRWAVLALLIFVPLITFAPACWSDFTTWDDNLNVSQNPYLNPPSMEGVAHFWVTPHMALYIPVTYTMWSILAVAARLDTPDAVGISLNPSIFHFANLLVHLGAVFAAYGLLLAITRRRWPACAGALLFALHPVQVESVAWVAGMKDVLCGMFSLLALWQYLEFAQKDQEEVECSSRPAARRWLHYGLATVLLVLAMLSKPSAMTVPVIALVLDRLIARRAWRQIAQSLWPWALLAIACAFVAHLVQPVPIAPDGGRIWARPLLAGAAVAFYLYKLIAPVSLAVQYHYSPQVLLAGRWLYFAWLIPVAVAIAIWFVRKRAPRLAVAALLFVIPVLPVLGLLPFQFERYSLTADHYLYVAMIGPAFALTLALSMLRETWLIVAGGFCGVGLALLAIRSDLQTFHWHDSQSLFEHALAVNPDSDAADNQLAQIALDQDHPQEAERFALNSIHAQPNQGDAYDVLGNALVRQKRLEKAAEAYRQTIERDPNNYAALTSLGAMRAGENLNEAIRLFQKAIEIEPTYEKAHLNLATAFANGNRLEDAIHEAEIAVRLAPMDPQAHRLLGIVLLRLGHLGDAVAHLREALRLNPNLSDVRRMLTSIPTQSR